MAGPVLQNIITPGGIAALQGYLGINPILLLRTGIVHTPDGFRVLGDLQVVGGANPDGIVRLLYGQIEKNFLLSNLLGAIELGRKLKIGGSCWSRAAMAS